MQHYQTPPPLWVWESGTETRGTIAEFLQNWAKLGRFMNVYILAMFGIVGRKCIMFGDYGREQERMMTSLFFPPLP